jgi:hypothetical protein
MKNRNKIFFLSTLFILSGIQFVISMGIDNSNHESSTTNSVNSASNNNSEADDIQMQDKKLKKPYVHNRIKRKRDEAEDRKEMSAPKPINFFDAVKKFLE